MKKSEEYEDRVFDIKKTIIVCIIGILLICVISLLVVYFTKEDFRKWADINVLRKKISSEDVKTIDLDVDKNNQVFCYDKYICILNDKNLELYNSLGESISEINININTALFASKDKYLAIAEKNGQEFCVILDKTYLWGEKVDGEILQIHVNKNGYVAVVTTDTTYKSTITIFDATGNEILKRFLKSTRVVDVSIGNDNKHIAFAEIDTSGALIQSNIKIISTEKAMEDEEKAIEYEYEADTSKMILKVKYQTNGNLLCVYDDSLDIISNGVNQEFLPVDKKMTFISGNLKDAIVYITEEQTGLFSSTSTATIVNTSNNEKIYYNYDEVAKELYSYENIIGINVGSEIYFIDTNGLLIKKYTSHQEITNVVLSDNLAIIVYKDRIEIVNL